MASQLRAIKIWLALAAESLAEKYLVWYEAIKNYTTVTTGGVLRADVDALTRVVLQLGGGAPRPAPHTGPLHPCVRHATRGWAPCVTGAQAEYLIAAIKTYALTKTVGNTRHPNKENRVSFLVATDHSSIWMNAPSFFSPAPFPSQSPVQERPTEHTAPPRRTSVWQIEGAGCGQTAMRTALAAQVKIIEDAPNSRQATELIALLDAAEINHIAEVVIANYNVQRTVDALSKRCAAHTLYDAPPLSGIFDADHLPTRAF